MSSSLEKSEKVGMGIRRGVKAPNRKSGDLFCVRRAGPLSGAASVAVGKRPRQSIELLRLFFVENGKELILTL